MHTSLVVLKKAEKETDEEGEEIKPIVDEIREILFFTFLIRKTNKRAGKQQAQWHHNYFGHTVNFVHHIHGR